MTDTITCPKCFFKNDEDELESTTEYSCWTGEDNQVYCLECGHHFNVHCEHRGFKPSYHSFDMREFLKAHNISIPDGISSGFVGFYMRELIMDGSTTLVDSDRENSTFNRKWLEAYEFAMKEWKRIKKIGDSCESNSESL